jgi:hypothetical protein
MTRRVLGQCLVDCYRCVRPREPGLAPSKFARLVVGSLARLGALSWIPFDLCDDSYHLDRPGDRMQFAVSLFLSPDGSLDFAESQGPTVPVATIITSRRFYGLFSQ